MSVSTEKSVDCGKYFLKGDLEMSSAQKHAKLANAIREYRGAWDSHNKKWIRAHRPHLLAYVSRWIVASCLPLGETLEKINGFKSAAEMDEWLKGL